METANPTTLTFGNRFPDPSTGSIISVNRYSWSTYNDIADWGINQGAYINDSTKATDGSRLVYINGNGCLFQDFAVGTTIAGMTTLTPGQTYTVTFDWCPFDHTKPTTPSGSTNVDIDFIFSDQTYSTYQEVCTFSMFTDVQTGTVAVNPRTQSAWGSLKWTRMRCQFVMPTPPAGKPIFQLQFSQWSPDANGAALFDNISLTQSCGNNVGMW